MRRREFITLLGGAAAAWPLAARAQQSERMRRIGVLINLARGRSGICKPACAAFLQGLQQLGWIDGRNVRIDYPLGRRRCRPLSQICGGTGRARAGRHPGPWQPGRGGRCYRRPAPCRSCSRSVLDPVGAGFVESLARPGGNATGFMLFEYGLSGKWLELLKQIAPSVTRAAVLRDPATAAGIGQFGRNPVRGAVARGGGEPGQCARRRRNRARRHDIRALGRMAA